MLTTTFKHYHYDESKIPSQTYSTQSAESTIIFNQNDKYYNVTEKNNHNQSEKKIILSDSKNKIENIDEYKIKRTQYINSYKTCNSLTFEIKCVDIFCGPTQMSIRYAWLTLNTKKLVFTNLPEKLIGCKYTIAVGGASIYHGTVRLNKNIYPIKYIPFGQLNFHNVDISIDTSHINNNDLKDQQITIKLTPYKTNEKIIDIVLNDNNDIIRFMSGMCGSWQHFNFKLKC